ncbi:MAG: Mut7-C RNAse domain-containing protein [Deltaproteobacteria bacterium]
MPTLQLNIDPELTFMLRHKWKGSQEVAYPLKRRASIKDILEAVGIPHTEIGCLSTGAGEIDFSYIPVAGELIAVAGIPVPFSVTQPSLLRPHTYAHIRFLTDLNVAKLASLLRLAGLDTLDDGNMPDEQLASLAAREERILLTKDRLLLCRNKVRFG